MDKTKKKKRIRAICLLGIAVIVPLRIYPEFVPWGASILPYTLARDRGPTLSSPSGARTVHVYFNDAGAMHSGNHMTWVVEDHLLFGPTVVAKGMLNWSIRNGDEPVPLECDEHEKPILQTR